MPIDTSEEQFEATIERVLTGGSDEAQVREPTASYGRFETGGYRSGDPSEYNRERCLVPSDLFDFLVSTQPKTWKRFKSHHGDNARPRFMQRLSRKIGERGTLDILRKGVKINGCKFKLVYFQPKTGLNPDLQKKYQANIFTVVRQLPYSPDSEHTLDLGLFLNGLPIFTAELKTPSKGQRVDDAKRQYRYDRDPRERLFEFRRCLAHFAVDTEEVHMTTDLDGEDTTFLPFNKGHNRGSGNPPVRDGYRTSYLWEEIWSPDSVLDLLQHYIHEIDDTDHQGRLTGDKILIFPRYHQLRSVRRLVGHARQHGAGENYLVQHSTGSGKSISIALLAHQLAFLHDERDKPVFDTVVVITDRRILDRQISKVIRQLEQQRGVVANVDAGSHELKKALEREKKVIVTTLQKFPYISEAVTEQKGTRFAVIIDEAHSSQTGEYRKHLNTTLAPSSLEEAESEDEVEEDDLEDKIRAEIKKRGQLDNVSNFAFTATPKPKTLELFGTRRPEGGFEPFDLYSMRQAIEEGFILDVLENYTTYTDYFRLLKKVEDDPRYDQRTASRVLRSFVSMHEHTIREKIEVMVEHFKEHVAHRIGGQAKAMIVTRSRLHAVRYRVALDRYLDEQSYPFGALVAFSGTVHDPDTGTEHTEAGMNGFSDDQTRLAFDRDEYRFLVVANKFQTGFDQPKLHTMYVDKKLGGVSAVQTLSRLNRTHPNKDETMVLDFVNEAEHIRDAFEPYYEKTTLGEATDPNLIHDLEHELNSYHFYTPDELDRFAELWFTPGGDQQALHALLDPVVERYADAEEDEQDDFRRKLGQYIRAYAFLSQVIPFEDTDLEVLYEFGRQLYGKLPIQRSEVPRELLQYVDLDSYRLQRTHAGSLSVDRNNEPLDPQVTTGAQGGSGTTEAPEEPLSEILRHLNERFGYDFTEDDKVFLQQWADNVAERDAVRTSIRVNAPDDARLTFEQVATDELQEMIDANFELYKRISEDDDFADVLLDFLFDKLRERVEEEEDAGSQ